MSINFQPEPATDEQQAEMLERGFQTFERFQALMGDDE